MGYLNIEALLMDTEKEIHEAEQTLLFCRARLDTSKIILSAIENSLRLYDLPEKASTANSFYEFYTQERMSVLTLPRRCGKTAAFDSLSNKKIPGVVFGNPSDFSRNFRGIRAPFGVDVRVIVLDYFGNLSSLIRFIETEWFALGYKKLPYIVQIV